MKVSGQHHVLATLPLGKKPGANWRGDWVGPRVSCDVLEKSKIFFNFKVLLFYVNM